MARHFVALQDNDLKAQVTRSSKQRIAEMFARQDLAVSDSVACGLREDGSATCWPGWDAPSRDFPGPFAQVRGSQAAFCAILADGTLSCWAGFRPPSLVQAAPPGRHTRLDMDARQACSLTADGALVCWHLDASREPRGQRMGRRCNARDGRSRCSSRRPSSRNDSLSLASGGRARYLGIRSSPARSLASRRMAEHGLALTWAPERFVNKLFFMFPDAQET